MQAVENLVALTCNKMGQRCSDEFVMRHKCKTIGRSTMKHYELGPFADEKLDGESS